MIQQEVREQVLVVKKKWIQTWAVEKILDLVKGKSFVDSTQYVHGKVSVNKDFRSSTSYNSASDAETQAFFLTIQDALFRDFFGIDADKWKAGASSFDIIRYKEGNELKVHADYFGDRKPDRRYTIVIGLKMAEKGGETSFPALKESILLEPGDVLFFENLLPDGKPNARSHHAGNKVLQGEKMVAVMFVNDIIS